MSPPAAMTSGRPRRAVRQATEGVHAERRLRTILGVDLAGSHSLAALVDRAPTDAPDLSPFPTLTYVETAVDSPTQWSNGETAIHVLWTAPHMRPVLRTRAGDHDPFEFDCAPGDFLLVPPGTSFAIGAGILAVVVGEDTIQDGTSPVRDGSETRNFSPTHGLSVFHGYNRQTFGVATDNLALCRWKLTQPQRIAAPPDRPIWLSNLVEPVAIAWDGGTDLLGRTEGVFLPPGCEVTVFPDDLGYILTAWRPDLVTEILPPLLSAGYSQADLTPLGLATRP